MAHLTFTDADRARARSLMAEAERRVGERTPAAESADDAPPPPRRAVRARRPEDRLEQAAQSSVPARIGRTEIAGAICGLILVVALIGAINVFAPARPVVETTTTNAPVFVAPTARVAPTPANAPRSQPVYAAPGGMLLGTIPQTATIGYRHSGWPGWAGVAWRGEIVWIQTSEALATLPDLAPPTPAPAPPAPPIQVPPVNAPRAEDAPPTRDSTHEKPHDEQRPAAAPTTRPQSAALPAKAAAPSCWPGPPAPNVDNAPLCWRGVPFVTP